MIRTSACFERTITALCDSILEERCPHSAGADAARSRAAGFVLDQCGRMPDFMRFALRSLVRVFDGEAFIRSGRRFDRLDHSARWRQIQSWRRSRLGVRRDFVRFFESLVIFGWYSAARDCLQPSAG